MRRWLTRILICLLLGAVTTVGVAWALAVLIPMGIKLAYSGVYARTDEPCWESAVFSETGALLIISQASNSERPGGNQSDPVPDWSRASRPPTRAQADRWTTIHEQARGWPMLSNYWREGGRTRESAVIPVGFLIDTLFYGALWFALILGFSAMKRALRTRPGLCPKCKYDLRGCDEPGCPECGWNRAEDES